MDLDERRRRGEELLRQMLGDEPAERLRQGWQAVCPDFEAYVLEFVSGEVWSRPGLDRRARSLVTIGALAALGRPLALELNVRLALGNGVSRQEVVEALLHLAVYAGFPAAWEGLAVARKVFRELDQTPQENPTS
jgi:alkylhydroperoxidase/carboxymuconolactone decarboxylase family protein YurZ